MRVVYTPAPGDDEETEVFGLRFVSGEPVTITSEQVAGKLRGHPSFEILSETKPKTRPGSEAARQAEAEALARKLEADAAKAAEDAAERKSRQGEQ